MSATTKYSFLTNKEFYAVAVTELIDSDASNDVVLELLRRFEQQAELAPSGRNRGFENYTPLDGLNRK